MDGLWYTIGDQKFPRVTSIIKDTLAAPALSKWFQKQIAGAAWEHRAHLASVGPEKEADAIDFLLKAPFKSRDKAASRGSSVHDLIELATKGLPFGTHDLPGEEVGRYEQWEKWRADNDIEFQAAEMTVVSEKYGYAGTLDAIVSLDGVLTLVDYKTGKAYDKIWDNQALQLGAYAGADYAWINSEKEYLPGPIKAAGIVYLQPDSYRFPTIGADELAMAVDGFRATLELWKWRRRFDGKGVGG